MTLPRYPEYRDSGVSWVGEVPEHWAVKRFKWLIERNDGGVWGDDPDGDDDTIVLRSTDQTVDGRWKLDEPALRKLSESERLGATLEVGDLLVTKSSGSSLHIGKTTLVDAQVASLRGCYSNFMQRLRLNAGLLPKLAWYLMNNDLARRQFDLASNSTTGLANLNGTMISEVLVPVPLGFEQAAIVTFLDHETAKIDGLIAEQEKLIALLAEKRQATISHAVIRGLNPQAPMKDSGVPWLGEVPAHWEVKQLKHLANPGSSITYGIVQAGPHVEGGIPYIKTSDMAGETLPLDGYSRTSREIDAAYARSKVVTHDIVIAIRATVGKCLPVPPELAGANLTQGTAKVTPSDAADSTYLLWTLRSTPVQNYFDHMAKGATFKEITLDALRRTPVPLPPKGEQQAIAKFIDDAATRFESLRGDAMRAVELLKERRSALIAAAVTGQIDVRGFVPPNAHQERAAA